jgi:hypothetical protein
MEEYKRRGPQNSESEERIRGEIPPENPMQQQTILTD